MSPRGKVLAAMPEAAEQDKLRAFEQEAVRHSLNNLMSFDAVKEAYRDGRVKLLGWVLDTSNEHTIMELDKDGQFKRMRDIPQDRSTGGQQRG